MAAAFDIAADRALLARPASDEVFAAVARDRWPACLREIERLEGQLEVVRAERDQARSDALMFAAVRDRLMAERDEAKANVATYLRQVDHDIGENEALRRERDEARRDLEALRSAIKPAFLSPLSAARLEADLEVYRAEESALHLVERYFDAPDADQPDIGEVRAALDALRIARAAAAKIGGGS